MPTLRKLFKHSNTIFHFKLKSVCCAFAKLIHEIVANALKLAVSSFLNYNLMNHSS